MSPILKNMKLIFHIKELYVYHNALDVDLFIVSFIKAFAMFYFRLVDSLFFSLIKTSLGRM